MRVKEIRADKMSTEQHVSSVDVTVGTIAAIIGAGDRGNGALHSPMASILTKPLLGDHGQTHRIEEDRSHSSPWASHASEPGFHPPGLVQHLGRWGRDVHSALSERWLPSAPYTAPGLIPVPMCPRSPAGLW